MLTFTFRPATINAMDYIAPILAKIFKVMNEFKDVVEIGKTIFWIGSIIFFFFKKMPFVYFPFEMNS